MKFSVLNQFRQELESFFSSYPKFVFARNPENFGSGIPVFVFHTIEPISFESQLIFLKENGYRTLSVNEFVDSIQRKTNFPLKSVLLTVDDGRSSFWRFGYPLLKKYGMNATLFIIAGRTLDSTTLRSNLLDVWDGKSSTQKINNIDPTDETLCNWNEIKEMYTSGLVEIESHTLFHKEVFVSSTIVDFVDPNTSFTPHNTPVTVYLELKDAGIALKKDEYYGLPLFKSASLMLGRASLKISRDMMAMCKGFYFEQKEEEKKNNGSWKKMLRKKLTLYENKISYQNEEETRKTIYEDIEASVEIIQQRVNGDVGKHLCLPWGVGSDLAVQVAKELGMKSCFWGSVKGHRINSPSDDPFHMVRIKNDFIWRLPGNKRKSLLAIYLYKVKRRLSSSEAIF